MFSRSLCPYAAPLAFFFYTSTATTSTMAAHGVQDVRDAASVLGLDSYLGPLGDMTKEVKSQRLLITGCSTQPGHNSKTVCAWGGSKHSMLTCTGASGEDQETTEVARESKQNA